MRRKRRGGREEREGKRGGERGVTGGVEAERVRERGNEERK